ncbi:hypothetical protein FQN57_007254 [Myotisia sp. PD_48]|nr:hypothetical protein FQN57_007254 [Myotisia sp. PD_48]
MASEISEQPVSSCEENKVCAFIDSLLISILDEMSRPDGNPSISLKRRSTQATYYLNQETCALQSESEIRTCTYSWPGTTAQEAWRFGVVLRILGLISETHQGNFVSSKRDIFYQDPAYFGSQQLVDRYIDDIAYTIDVDRTALHVTAAAKGLICGCCKLKLKNGIVLDVAGQNEGIIISRTDEIEQIDLSGVAWILVIEKEAVFHRLATSNCHNLAKGRKGILLTGKGYPDLNTRAFLRLLSDTARSNPSSNESNGCPTIYALVDCDPDGLAIMSTYKYGSMAQVHENSRLNVPEIRWLGLRLSETLTSMQESSKFSLLQLTQRDRKKAEAMLKKNPSFAEGGPEPSWRRELQVMLMLNLKAEIEILYELDGGMASWFQKNICW